MLLGGTRVAIALPSATEGEGGLTEVLFTTKVLMLLTLYISFLCKRLMVVVILYFSDS